MLRKPLGAAKRSLMIGRFARPRGVSVHPAAHDWTLVLRAECDDGALSPAALTTSAELLQQLPGALLNNVNRPLLVFFLLLLHRRGALKDGHTRQKIARFLVPSVHFDWLPWMWGDGAGPAESSDGIAALRLMSSFLWRSAVERSKPTEPSEQLHYWHQVLFALSANPVFGEAATFDDAHREFLVLIHDYYTDVVYLQSLLPPLSEGTVVTRMPPVLVRKLRKLYVDQYCLLQYAELFRAIVDGEELVAPVDGTALLNDAEVFEYYLTIPGRRESGLERDGRWVRTLEYATFALQKLFRQHCRKGVAVVSAMTRPATLFMNICVFARNDNAEGERYREAILAVMRVFCAEFGNKCGRSGGSSPDTAWDVLRVFRDAGVECMIAKCRRLHFGPMRGLLDVCTVAAVTENFLCVGAGTNSGNALADFCRDELEILLSHRKLIGEEMYDAAQSYSCQRFAAYYGLLNLATRVNAELRSVVQLSTAMQRYTSELTKWGVFIGRPLRLNFCDVSSSPQSSSLSEHVTGDPVLTWRCGCQSVNVVKPGHVACISCVSRSLVEHTWSCPHCSWVSASGDRVDICLGCRCPHPSRTLETKRDDDIAALNDVPVTPFLWYCNVCLSYSFLSSDVVTGTGGCVECGTAGRGWSTGFFLWKCGCGELNTPSRRWCSACSMRQGRACCTCITCGEEWKLQPCRLMAGGDVCSSCKEVHPRDAVAWRRRLLRCPYCHSLTPSDVEACQNCRQRRAVLGQFLPRLPDWPWLCHACGQRHHHRDPEGALRPPSHSAAEACEKCGALRPDPVLFDMHETWRCADCGGHETRGFSCRRCLALHPAIPAAEVHAWRCAACCSVNSSWEPVCQRRGCGARRSADSPALPYAPWRCRCCGAHSRSAQVPQCERCGAVRATAASLVAEGTADERRLRRLAEVEAMLTGATAASDDGDVPDLGSAGVLADDWSRFLADSLRLAVPL